MRLITQGRPADSFGLSERCLLGDRILLMSPRLVHVQTELPIRTPRGAKAISQRSRRVAETRFDRTAWGAASSNHTISTIQSPRTADFEADSKRAGRFCGIFAGIVLVFRSPVTLAVSQVDFSLPSLHPKIPFPARAVRRGLCGLEGREKIAVLGNKNAV